MSSTPTPAHETLSDWVRTRTAPLAHVVGQTVGSWGLTPNWISAAALLVTAVGAVCMGLGHLRLAGWLVLVGGGLDALDGAVARAMGDPPSFGAVLDATLDRYADGFIFGGLSYYFAVQNQTHWMLLAWAAMIGSMAVSYVRARAGGPDVRVVVRVGVFTRFERVLLMVVALWFHTVLMVPILLALTVGTHFTAVHRLIVVYRLSGR